MANENKESLTIGQALDLIIKNADKRIGDLEVANADKDNQIKVLSERLERIATYLNKQKANSKEKAKTQEVIKEVDDTNFLASQTKVEVKPVESQSFDKQVLLDKINDTEETGVDWTIRIKGQFGSSLVLAKYEHEELYNIVASSHFALPYKDNKWTIEQLENGLIKVDKLGKDNKHYFGLI